MTNKEICQAALAENLVHSSTEFWKGQRESTVDPTTYLVILRDMSSAKFVIDQMEWLRERLEGGDTSVLEDLERL